MNDFPFDTDADRRAAWRDLAGLIAAHDPEGRNPRLATIRRNALYWLADHPSQKTKTVYSVPVGRLEMVTEKRPVAAISGAQKANKTLGPLSAARGWRPIGAANDGYSDGSAVDGRDTDRFSNG